MWRAEGLSDRVVAHINAAHELQPDNITYKRQAYSALRVSRVDDEDDFTRFRQAPEGDEEWPFASDFNRDFSRLHPELAARLGIAADG